MEETEEERRKNRRVDLLYNDLEYISKAYFTAEQVFPFWEAALALIVGQLIVAYFNPGVCGYQQKWLAAIGCIISYIWFILVSLNLQTALSMDAKLKGSVPRFL